METSELKTALLNGWAVIYRADGMGGIRVTVEIEDKNGRSVVIVDPAKIRYKDEKRE